MINQVWRGFACQQDVFFARVRKLFFGAFFLGATIYLVPGLAQAGCISGTCGAPIVSVYSPSNNASLPASQNITISGRAFGDVVWTWDGESYNFPINRVDIYRDGSVVGQATLGPTSYTDDEIPYNDFTYTFVGGIASPGSHTLSAKPFDTGSNAFAAAGQVQTIAISIAAPPQNGALVISASAPSPMTQGQSFLVSVTMQNTGNTTWPAGSAYKLGSKNPIDNWTWGTARIGLASSVAPGQQTTFTFAVVAPAAGDYSMQWGMLQEGLEWFGGTSNSAVAVNPQPLNGAQVIAVIAPSPMIQGQSHNVSVTMQNTGNTTWPAGSNYMLGAQNPAETTLWGVQRVALGSNVAPGQRYTFAFPVVAPAAGQYNMQWQMMQRYVEWFGGQSSSAVQVNAPPAPTVMVTRTPSPMAAGQPFTLTWSTANATSLARTCTSTGTGYTVNDAPTTGGSGTSTSTASSTWVSYPSTCNWTATGPGGTKTVMETMTTSAVLLSSDVPVPVMISPPHQNNADAGTLMGTLGIDQNGAAIYGMLLPVPPGTAGMQPVLSLNYSSLNQNGLVGMGWSLGGLSSINRCMKSSVRDGVPGRISFDTADRLCLDGQRLVRIDGSNPGASWAAQDAAYWAAGGSYRLEEEAFARITRLPSGGFRMEAKDGRIHYFGTDTGTAIAAQGRIDGQPLLWALARTEDRKGNYLTVEYNQDLATGEYTPRQIRYGGNSGAAQLADLAVRFSYEARADAMTMYAGGSRNDRRTRLTHIATFIDTAGDGSAGTLMRDHQIHYADSANSGRSLVDWMQASAQNPNTGVLEFLPKTVFTWGIGAAPAMKPLPIPAFALPMIGRDEPGRLQMDLDGSGRTSFIAAASISCGKPGEVNCFKIPYIGIFTGALRIRLPDGRVIDRTLDVAASGITTDTVVGIDSFMTGDIDGNGSDDLVVINYLDRKWGYCLSIPAADGTVDFSCHPGGTGRPTLVDLRNDRKMHLISRFDSAGNTTDCSYEQGAMTCSNLHLSDLTPLEPGLGGLVSLDFFKPTGISLGNQSMSDLFSTWEARVPAINPNNAFGIQCTDGVNGQVCQPVDVVRAVTTCLNKQDGIVCRAAYQARSVGTTAAGLTGGVDVGDLNGDGLTDFAYALDSAGSANGTYVCLSRESDVGCTHTNFAPSALMGNSDLFVPSYIGDFIGDGTERALFITKSTLPDSKSYLCRYSDTGFVCDTFVYTPPSGPKVGPVFLDGSGIAAFLVKTGALIDNQPAWSAVSLVGPPELDRLIRVVDGMGQVNEIDYARGDDATVHRRYAVIDGVEQRSAYPRMARTPGVLAKQLRRGNGQGGWLSSNYRYDGAAIDASGRGSLGFAQLTVTDYEPKIATVTTLSQSFPFIGMVLRSVATARDGVVLVDTQNHLAVQTLNFPNGAQTMFAFVDQASSIRKDLDGSPMGSTTGSMEYGDGWGNVTATTVTTSAGAQSYVSKTVTAYDNASTSWLIGQATSVAVTKTDPLAGNVTRVVEYVYDGNGQLKQDTIEPRTPLQIVLTHDRSANLFGLENKTIQNWTDPFSGMPMARTLLDKTYDSKGRFVKASANAMGHASTHTYYPGTGVRRTTSGPNLLATTWTADGFGRVSVELYADGNEVRRSGKACQNDCPANASMASITDRFHGGVRIAAPAVLYSDSGGRLLRTLTWGFDGRQVVTDQRYDTQGRLFEVDQPRYAGDSAFLAQRQNYDDLNRVVRVATLGENGAERAATRQYNGVDNIIVNAKQQQRTETVDALGRIVLVKDARLGLTKLDYDGFGNLLSTTDPTGNVITIGYDNLGRRVDLKDPDLGWTHYDIDPAGRMWKQESAKQRAAHQFTRYQYDLLDRMTGRYETDLESHWVYDTAVKGIGQLAEAFTGPSTAKDFRRLHSYDSVGRASTTTQMLIDGSYLSTPEYDAWGRIIRQRYQRGSDAPKVFEQRYNGNGYLATIERGPLVLWAVISQDAAQRPTLVKLGNGLTQERTFNPRTAQMDDAKLRTASQALRLQEGYQFDAISNVSQRTQYWDAGGFIENFGYDELNRLTSSEVLGKPGQVFTFGAGGNLLSKTGEGNGDYVYPAQGVAAVQPHAVRSIPGIGSFDYDLNGNLSSGAGRTISWNSFNQPITISKGTASSSFVYGAEHQRTRQDRSDGSRIVYAGAQEVVSTSSAVTVKTYWPHGVGVEIDRPNAGTELDWSHADRLGSIVAISDINGELKEKLAYDAWGKRRLPDGSATPDILDGQVDDKGYTGHEMLDQLDLVHMNGRVYDPATARFISADPHVQELSDGQNHDRYSYVLNNPTNLTDPTGFDQILDPTVQIVIVQGVRPPADPPMQLNVAGASVMSYVSAWETRAATNATMQVVRVVGKRAAVAAFNMASTGLLRFSVGATLLFLPGNAFQQQGDCHSSEMNCAMDPSTGLMSKAAYWAQVKASKADNKKDDKAGAASSDSDVADGTNTEDKPNLIDEKGEKHILDGDKTGGGHRPGTGKPGKSEFPTNWTDDKIKGEISDVATDPGSTRTPGRGGRTVVQGTRDGIDITVVIEGNGRIVTGFPTNVPRNPK